MENNKILIGAQFTEENKTHTIELIVPRDITLFQLFEGIKYGLKRMALDTSNADHSIYSECLDIYNETLRKDEVTREREKIDYWPGVTISSCNLEIATKYLKSVKIKNSKNTDVNRISFMDAALNLPICDLGFVTSSKIIFDKTGSLDPFLGGGLDTESIIAPFNPQTVKRLFYPEYNISSRQLYKFDDAPVEIIAPETPPQKPDNNILVLLLPSLLTIIIMVMVRTIFINGGFTSNMSLIAMTVAMGIVGIITTIITWKRQVNSYEEKLKGWRKHYQDYIDRILKDIRIRQLKDSKKIEQLYPDTNSLLQEREKGVFSANSNIFSRAAYDPDFLCFRIGISENVENFFEIRGDVRDVIFSEAFFDIVTNNKGEDNIRLFLRNEINAKEKTTDALCHLPSYISHKYRYMPKAPLLYSLKSKSCLGVVDANLNLGMNSLSYYFLSRMIFELCYYHSPENLQFVMFFNERDSWDEIERDINIYKYMPHFRELFDDKSQFVFNKIDADLVMSSLFTIMNERSASSNEDKTISLPHIVVIVMEEHGLKEHPFANYLPNASKAESEQCGNFGLTFVFAKEYREYLPAYCDDIVYLNDNGMQITQREGYKETKVFSFDSKLDEYGNSGKTLSDRKLRNNHMSNYIRDLAFAYRFLSPMYYARIAQNGKVPSSVSFLDLIKCKADDLTKKVESNWHFGKKDSSVSEGLKVAVGCTESETIYLDLHEKTDGPHMLVAGTTGSGKTEAIITYLLGLCMKYRPDEVNLLLIDMKGGGFTNRLGHLPHVVGAITDVEGDENGTGAVYMLQRFLAAIKAEVKRRKILFNKLHVDNIDDYIAACNDIEKYISSKQLQDDNQETGVIRDTAANNPLTHLILVVDEFTELKRFSNENDDVDFIGEITTLARVGRSLGFHIILISQNIEGAITDDIRVNSKSRLCLRVATKQASKEMLGADLAASPNMPGNGRAYLLVGTGEKLVYYQSGYSGSSIDTIIPIEFTLASKNGKYISFYRSNKDNERLCEKQDSISQLEAVISSILYVFKEHEEEFKIHKVFCGPLPRRIALSDKDNMIKILD